MQASSLSPGVPVQFNSFHKESVLILDEYLCRQIKDIPRPLRYNIVNRFKYNTQSFIESYQKNFQDKYDRGISIDAREFKAAGKLYGSMVSFMRALESKSISKGNFRLRCELLSGAIPMKREEIEKYMDYSPFNFHLCGCLYEIIFNRLEVQGWKRGILENYTGYSNKYEKLAPAEVAKRGHVTYTSFRQAKNVLERRINNVIKYFKVLAPYYTYKSKYLPDGETIKTGREVFDRLRREEKAEEMTPYFIAKVLSVVYNYKLEVSSSGGIEEYRLIQRE
jgi:hypothetical protein